MKKIVPLTEMQVRKAKPREKNYLMFDGGGLFLLILSTGGKSWRMKYRFNGAEGRLTFGTYPGIDLPEARARREEVRKLIAAGIDPKAHKKAQAQAAHAKAANSFEVVALEWFAKKAKECSPGHAENIESSLRRDILPYLGSRPIADIKPPELVVTANRVAGRGVIHTCHRVMGVCGEIFRFGLATGRCESDPTRDLRGVLPKMPRARNRAAPVVPEKVGALLRAIYGYQGGAVVRAALRLAPLVFVRPGELRHAEWKDIDLEKAEWRFVHSKQRDGREDIHVVPLARQAVEVLKELHFVTGQGRYVFPSFRTPDGSRPMSNNAILVAFRSMGFPKEEVTGHGLRATAKTLLSESLRTPQEYIERQLSHASKEAYGTAYDRANYLAQRREMMQQWADYLDELKAGKA